MRKRNHVIRFRMNDDELACMSDKVSRTATRNREEFLRDLVQGCKIIERPPAEYGDILRELRRIGSNVNQLLVVARTRGFVDELKLKRIQADIRSMDETFRIAFIGEK